MEPVPSPVPGSAGHAGTSGRWMGGVLRCLHFLTCGICDPPPEVPDTARLALALATFGASAALLAGVLCSRAASLAYCALGLARLLPARGKSLAVVGGFSVAAWLALLCLPASWASGGPAALALVSELCWLLTLRRVLDEEFDIFVAVLFLFLGVELTFGFYPMLLEWGPKFLDSPEVQETVQVVVTHAVQAGKQAGSSAPGQPPRLGGDAGDVDGAKGMEEPSEPGSLLIFSQLLPLLVLLVGVPGLAFLALISCWMFEHMSRMVLAVSVSFVSWMALYACLAFLHVPVSRELFGKAILGSACILMYHAFSRLTCTDWSGAQRRLTWLTGAFGAVFLLDQLLSMAKWQSPLLLFAVLVCCKQTYSTWANFLEAEGRGPFQAKHLSPFRPWAWRGEALGGGGAAEERSAAQDGPRSSASRPLNVPDYI